jgi:hypothetical protein
MTVYLHHVPGRLRIHIAGLRGSEAAVRLACGEAMTIDGVTKAHGDPTTGSLVVLYDRRRLTPALLWEALAERALVSGLPPFADGAGVTRLTGAATQNGEADAKLVGALAGIAVEKLVERFAVALLGALI